jgi:hypothetical protein
MDGFSIAFLGSFIAYDGDWEYGCRLSAMARSLNPHYPGWYWFVSYFDAFRKGDYRLSLEFARKVNMPSLWRANAVMAAVLGQLGEIESARILLQTLLTQRPKFKAEAWKILAQFWGPDLVEGMIEVLRRRVWRLPTGRRRRRRGSHLRVAPTLPQPLPPWPCCPSQTSARRKIRYTSPTAWPKKSSTCWRRFQGSRSLRVRRLLRFAAKRKTSAG